MGGSNYQMYDLSVGNTYTSITTTPVTALPVDKYKIITVQISGLTVETVTLTGSVLGATSLYSPYRPIDNNTGAVAAATALGNGSYRLIDVGISFLSITKSAGAETVTISISGRC